MIIKPNQILCYRINKKKEIWVVFENRIGVTLKYNTKEYRDNDFDYLDAVLTLENTHHHRSEKTSVGERQDTLNKLEELHAKAVRKMKDA